MEKPIISLSTCYLQSKFKGDGYAMLQEAAEMGFEYVELGHSTTVQTVEGITKALNEGVVKVSSLHNFCPIPPFASGACPNLFSPATKSPIESGQWRRHTLNTLEFAKNFNAKAMVMHSGSLSYFFRPPDGKISAYIDRLKEENKNKAKESSEEGEENGGAETADAEKPLSLSDDKAYIKLRDKFVELAKKRSEKRDYNNLFKNISSVHDAADEGNLFIGIENRDNIPELPLDCNIDVLLGMFKDLPRVRAWHDVGHSKRKELLLLCKQTELVERTLDSIIGWHLHDCTDAGKDHVAIGKGAINFGALAKYFDPKKHIFTLELNHAVLREDAIDSRRRVEDLMQ